MALADSRWFVDVCTFLPDYPVLFLLSAVIFEPNGLFWFGLSCGFVGGSLLLSIQYLRIPIVVYLVLVHSVRSMRTYELVDWP